MQVQTIKQNHSTFGAKVRLKGEYNPNVFTMFEQKTSEYPNMLLVQSHVAPKHKDEFELVNQEYSKLYGVTHSRFTADRLNQKKDWTVEECVNRLVDIFNKILNKSK